MEKDFKNGCISILAIIICLIISLLTLGFLVKPLGFLAYPIIVGGGLLLAKFTEPFWYGENKD